MFSKLVWLHNISTQTGNLTVVQVRKLEPTAIGRLNQMKPNDIKDVLKTSASSC